MCGLLRYSQGVTVDQAQELPAVGLYPRGMGLSIMDGRMDWIGYTRTAQGRRSGL